MTCGLPIKGNVLLWSTCDCRPMICIDEFSRSRFPTCYPLKDNTNHEILEKVAYFATQENILLDKDCLPVISTNIDSLCKIKRNNGITKNDHLIWKFLSGQCGGCDPMIKCPPPNPACNPSPIPSCQASPIDSRACSAPSPLPSCSPVVSCEPPKCSRKNDCNSNTLFNQYDYDECCLCDNLFDYARSTYDIFKENYRHKIK